MRKNENNKNVKKPRFYDDALLRNMKNYYDIEDNAELLKYIKLHGLHHNDHFDTEEKDTNKLKKIST